MNKFLCITFTVAVGLVFVNSETNITPSVQCPGQSFENLQDRIQVLPCGNKRCKLQKNTNTTVIFKFKPTEKVESLENDVYASIGELKLPFIGVTGQNACPNVKRADNGEPAPCPLMPGEEYIYTNVFPIEKFYPTVSLRVHWSLNYGDKQVICFEVPAVITAAAAKNN